MMCKEPLFAGMQRTCYKLVIETSRLLCDHDSLFQLTHQEDPHVSRCVEFEPE
jgi:hypothetical protein